MTSNGIIVVFILWFAAMFVFAWSNSSGIEPTYSGDPSFHMLNSDQMFFRNLRISEYYSSYDSSAVLEILRHKDLHAFVPVVPAIFINSRHHQAYLRFQGAASIAVLGNDTVFINPESEVATSFNTGVELLTLLDRGAHIRLIDKTEHVQVLSPGSSETKAFRECLEDFFRLVRRGNNQ